MFGCFYTHFCLRKEWVLNNTYQLSKNFIFLVLVDPLLLLDRALLNLLYGANLIGAEVDCLGDLAEAPLPDYFYRLEMLHQVLISLVPLDESFVTRGRLVTSRYWDRGSLVYFLIFPLLLGKCRGVWLPCECYCNVGRLRLFRVHFILFGGFWLLILVLFGDMLGLLPFRFLNHRTLHGWSLNDFIILNTYRNLLWWIFVSISMRAR